MKANRFPFILRTFFVIAVMTVFGTVMAMAQDAAPVGQPAEQDLIESIKGIELGMTAKDASTKLGKPEVSDDTGMFFELDGDESVQIRFDGEKKITTIAVVYSGKSDAPEPAEVFGPATKIEPQENGRLYKMVITPTHTVTYSRIKLDRGEMTTVTLQKRS